MNNENEVQPRRDRDARASTSPLRGRTAHSMYTPAPAPAPVVHQPIRRVVTAPPVYHSPPVYGPDPNLIYGAPAPVYAAPLPYIPQYAHNTSMYYPPPIQQPQVVIRQTQMAPAYGNYDPNFQAYFGADVVPQGALSPIDQQREQYELLSRNRVSRVDSSYNSQSQSSIQATMDAEARQLEEAIQLSLTESSRRVARPTNVSVTSEYHSGFTTRTNSTRSAASGVSGIDLRSDWDAESTIAPASTNMTPEELADEKALQEAIMESIREAEREQDRILSPRSSQTFLAESTRYEAPRSFVKPTPAPPVDRQYPYNLDSNVRRLTSPQKTRPVRADSAYQQGHHSYSERSSSAHRRQESVSPRYSNNDDEFEYYPEARRTSHGSSHAQSRSSHHHESQQYAGYDVHTSPRNMPEEETRGRTLHRRTASGRDFYEKEGPRRTSSGRDLHNVDSPRQLKGRTASGRDFVEHEVRGRMVRKTPSGRDFLDSDYHPYDPRRNIGTSPEVAAAVRALVSEKSITEQRSTSASRERANIRTDYEDSDYSREYSEGRVPARRPSASPPHARVTVSHHISSQMSSSGISAAEAAESRYTRTSPEFSKFAPARQSRIYDSPQTSDDDLSSHEEIPLEKLPLPARPVLPPPPVFRAPPPVFGHATLRAPTPPPPLERMVSGTKHIQ